MRTLKWSISLVRMMSHNEQQAGDIGDSSDGSQDFTSKLAAISVLWVLAALLAGGGLVAFSDVLASLV